MRSKYSGFFVALMFVTSLGLQSCSDDEGETSPEESAAESSEIAAQTVSEDEPGTTAADDVAPHNVPRDASEGIAVADAYRQQCPAVEEPSEQCRLLRSLVVAYVTLALEEIEMSRDQRGTVQALKALNIADEPEILIAAMRVLGRFPDTPGIAEKVLPLLLDSPWLKVQEIAARLLSSIPDPAVSGIGAQWGGHNVLPYTDDVYAELPPFPEHYWDMGFPEYPEAEWFTPADSDRSVGWITKDTPEVVIGNLSQTPGVEVLNYEAWSARSQQIMVQMFQPPDPSQMEEMQKVMEEYMRTQDPKLAERIESMTREAQEESDRLSERMEKMLISAAQPPSYAPPNQWNFLVAEERDGRISRLIMVYPVPAIGQTAIQMMWDLNDYPPAWELEE